METNNQRLWSQPSLGFPDPFSKDGSSINSIGKVITKPNIFTAEYKGIRIEVLPHTNRIAIHFYGSEKSLKQLSQYISGTEYIEDLKSLCLVIQPQDFERIRPVCQQALKRVLG